MASQIIVRKIGNGRWIESPSEPLPDLQCEHGQFIWLDITQKPDATFLNHLEEQLGLHEIALDDLFDTTHNPRLLEFDDHLLLGARVLKPDEDGLNLSSFGIVLGKGFLITFHETPVFLVEQVKKRIISNHSQILNKGADRLLYLLLDALVDHYYELLDTLSDAIDSIDDRASDLGQKQDLSLQRDILDTKRQLLAIHRAAAPLRDALLNVRRSSRTLISESNELYLRDVFEHILQLLDTVETYREILSSTTELIMSAASNRMNEIMTFLTVFTTFFIPVNFITSYYGMNLVMPEAHLPVTYPLVIGIMAAMIGFMFVWFKRKHWL